MKTIPENVKKLLESQPIWYLGTFSQTPNAVPIAFKEFTGDGRLVLADVFMETTKANLLANGKASVSACDAGSMEGYQIKGTAQYLADGPVVDQCKAVVEGATKGALHAKGAVVITPEEIINLSVKGNNERL